MRTEESDFLTTGIDAYFDATSTIDIFEQMVQNTCIEIVQNRIKEYGRSIGCSLDKTNVRPFRMRNEGWAGVGADFKIQKNSIQVLFRHIISWYLEDGICYKSISISIIFPRVKFVDRAKRIFGEHHWKHKSQIGIGEELEVKDFSNFGKAMDRLLRKWMRFWEKAGGLGYVLS